MNSVQLLYYSKIYKNSIFFRKLNSSLKSDSQFGENINTPIKFNNYNILKNLKLKQFQLNTINKMKIIENYSYNDKNYLFKNKVGFLSDPIFTGKSFSILGFFQTLEKYYSDPILLLIFLSPLLSFPNLHPPQQLQF